MRRLLHALAGDCGSRCDSAMDSKYVVVAMGESAESADVSSCPLFELSCDKDLRDGGKWCRLRGALRRASLGTRLMLTAAGCLLFVALVGFLTSPNGLLRGCDLMREAIRWANWEHISEQKAAMTRYGVERDPLELNKMPIWVVSLKRANERRQKIQSQMDAQKIGFTFMDAIDGLKEPVRSEELALFAGRRAKEYKQGVEHELKKVATDVTNWRLMHRMLAEKFPLVLIMEDDFLLPEGDFLSRLNETMAQLPADWDLFALNGCSMHKHGHTLGRFVGRGVRVFKTGSCTLAVVVRRETAIKVLKAAERQLRVQNWDNLIMGYMAQTGELNTYLADPPLCLFNEKMPSSIEPGKEPIQDILRP
ncbi:hypothetical protein KFL_000240440 [Klebsormidium nitens]|uniref:Glycosyl transferase family 25 domain-containing protein n=1 Tax=Klebsormidium nitens TaxID=105231 RepID=A0A1Y1HN16_KLENI|nr:hypothetical protein KFL_000240440 [Klebsormidium nitens]|eukprot:GAQ79112.1 hypothetical protein KFL_000240440 [Klebsormidium nitens]